MVPILNGRQPRIHCGDSKWSFSEKANIAHREGLTERHTWRDSLRGTQGGPGREAHREGLTERHTGRDSLRGTQGGAHREAHREGLTERPTEKLSIKVLTGT